MLCSSVYLDTEAFSFPLLYFHPLLSRTLRKAKVDYLIKLRIILCVNEVKVLFAPRHPFAVGELEQIISALRASAIGEIVGVVVLARGRLSPHHLYGVGACGPQKAQIHFLLPLHHHV